MTHPHTIAVLGGGLIGASWSALFLAYGHRVRIADPNPQAADYCRDFIIRAWPHLSELVSDLPDTPPLDQLTVFNDIGTACHGATFVQECGPDRIGPKQQIVAQAEAALAADVLIASSTSSLMATDIQAQAQHPGRILVAHPMNPPHLVPLVELVAGDRTAPDTLPRAEAFYASLDRVTIRVQKERPGHLANRLTSALYREAVNIVAEGIASVADVDRAIAYGPGMRWGLMGPHLIYHLGGGPGGIGIIWIIWARHRKAAGRIWASPPDPELVEELVAGLEQEIAGLDPDQIEASRDRALVALAKLKQGLPF
ncbi:MAG: 3-hydroxyacyl-CoA dehydrogenase NAD-binding domain-containing protein [Thalassovita sp.]